MKEVQQQDRLVNYYNKQANANLIASWISACQSRYFPSVIQVCPTCRFVLRFVRYFIFIIKKEEDRSSVSLTSLDAKRRAKLHIILKSLSWDWLKPWNLISVAHNYTFGWGFFSMKKSIRASKIDQMLPLLRMRASILLVNGANLRFKVVVTVKKSVTRRLEELLLQFKSSVSVSEFNPVVVPSVFMLHSMTELNWGSIKASS